MLAELQPKIEGMYINNKKPQKRLIKKCLKLLFSNAVHCSEKHYLKQTRTNRGEKNIWLVYSFVECNAYFHSSFCLLVEDDPQGRYSGMILVYSHTGADSHARLHYTGCQLGKKSKQTEQTEK